MLYPKTQKYPARFQSTPYIFISTHEVPGAFRVPVHTTSLSLYHMHARAYTRRHWHTHTHTHNVTCAPLRLISPQHWRASKEVLIVSTLKQVLVLCQHVVFYNVTTLALEGYKALLIHKPWSQASCFVCLFEEDLKRCCKSKSRSFAPLSGQLSFIEL